MKALSFLFLITVVATANLKHLKKIYGKHIKQYLKEKRSGKEPLVILIWWAPNEPLLHKIPEECGSCWLTHERHLEKEAAGIIFDQTRYKTHFKHNFGLPDFKHRNTEKQYWVWWPRESASKGMGNGMDWNLVGKNGWDGAFNLTASYRRDSDVTRTWGTPQKAVNDVRHDYKTGKVVSYQEHILGELHTSFNL